MGQHLRENYKRKTIHCQSLQTLCWCTKGASGILHIWHLFWTGIGSSSSLLALSSVPTRTHIIPLASGCLHPYHSLIANALGAARPHNIPPSVWHSCIRYTSTPELRHIPCRFCFSVDAESEHGQPFPSYGGAGSIPGPARRARRCPRCWRRQAEHTGPAVFAGKGNLRFTEYSALAGSHKDHRVQLLYGLLWFIKDWNPRSWCYQHRGLMTEPMAGSGMPYCRYGWSGKQITFYINKTFYVLPVGYFTRVWLFSLSCLWWGLYLSYYVLYIPIYTSLQIVSLVYSETGTSPL